MGFLDLHTMLLDEYQERLFVGGRDLVYSLNLERISDGYREVSKEEGKRGGMTRLWPDLFLTVSSAFKFGMIT